MGRKKKSKSSVNNNSTPYKDSYVSNSAITNHRDLNSTLEKKESLVVHVRKLDTSRKSKNVKEENERIVDIHPDDAFVLSLSKNDRVMLVELERTQGNNNNCSDVFPRLMWDDDVNGRKVEPKFIALCKVNVVQKNVKGGGGSTGSTSSASKRNNAFSPRSPTAKSEINPGFVKIHPPSLAQKMFLSTTLSSPINHTNSTITPPSPITNPTTPTNQEVSLKSKSSTPSFSFKSFVSSPSSATKSKSGEKMNSKILIIPLKNSNAAHGLTKQLVVSSKELYVKPLLQAPNSSTLIPTQVLKRSKRILEQMVRTVCNDEYFRINDIVTISFQGRRMQFEISHAIEEKIHQNDEHSFEDQSEALDSAMKNLHLDDTQSNQGQSTITDEILSQLVEKNVRRILYGVSQDTIIQFDFEDDSSASSALTSASSSALVTQSVGASGSVLVHKEKSEEYEQKLVAGLDAIIERIHTFLIPTLLHPELFPRRGPIRAPKGILIYGSHGCGKSLLAQQIERNFSSKSFKDLYSTTNMQVETVRINSASIQATTSIVGEAERKLTKLFEKAEYRTREGVSTLLIFDDIHLLCPRRGAAGSTAGSDRVSSTLLALMDGIGQSYDDYDRQGSKPRGNVSVLAIATSPALLDPALRRAGRLDNEIEVPNPDDNARAEIFEFAFNKLRIEGMSLPELDRKSYMSLAKLAKGFTGGDCTLTVKEAVRSALMRPRTGSKTDILITYEDIQQAIKKTKPSAIKSITVEIPSVPWSSIGGMDEVKSLLREAIELPLTHFHLFQSLKIPPPRGVLLYGPPGCSKTLMARALATEGHMNFLTVKGPELLS